MNAKVFYDPQLVGVIADKIEDGTLFDAGIISRAELAQQVRSVLRVAEESRGKVYAIKETGLMFKAPLVRAILEGRKTQTRRVMANQPCGQNYADLRVRQVGDGFQWHSELGESSVFNCPLGKPGDRIYVRESYRVGGGGDCACYDPCGRCVVGQPMYAADFEGEESEWGPWKPSVHMSKQVARIWLEVTGVRVERLQEITPDDCIAEGAWPAEKRELGRGHEAIEAFSELWESTGGDWEANLWVWVIDFRVLSTTGRPA